jgi:uncharacterized protein YjiK
MILSLASLAACSQDDGHSKYFEKPGYSFPYDLAVPARSWKLPGSLTEISGLSYIDEQRLACVQDEKGIIYIFNLPGGKVESEIIFGDDGDYEDIEVIQDDAWVLKSNGTLYQVEEFLKNSTPAVNKYPTALSRRNDTEGLAYDPDQDALLMACKEEPFPEEIDATGSRAVYRFDRKSGTLVPDPSLLINLDKYSYHKNFMPSGIAIQPVTGNIFIIGSVGKLLLVLSEQGEMLAIIKLNPKIFPQPEGICFSPDGTLFISNEGAGGTGTILEF